MQILKKGIDLYLWRNIQLTRSRLLLFSALFVFATALFIMDQYPYSSVGIILIPLAYVFGIYSYSKYMTWGSGIRGEDVVSRSLSDLSDYYYQIDGVVIPPNRGDTDHITLGPNGIFVIESKNYGGEIKCEGDSWSRQKVSKRGKPYKLWIGSPSNQVKRNAKVLKDFILERKDEIFKGRDPHIWVNVIVVFTNENADLIIKKPTVNVLRVEELSDFISQVESETRFSDEEIKRMGDVILRYAK